MALKMSDKVPAQPAEAPTTVLLQLTAYKRYIDRRNTLFTSDQPYEVSVEMAKAMLREVTPEGLPIWSRWTKKQTVQVVDGSELKVRLNESGGAVRIASGEIVEGAIHDNDTGGDAELEAKLALDPGAGQSPEQAEGVSGIEL